MRTKNKRLPALTIAAALVCTLAACATPSNPDAMTVAPPATAALQIPPNLRSEIAIRDVIGGSETNAMLKSNIDSSAFESALEASLRNSGLGAPNRQAGSYQLEATIKQVDQPVFGFSMTVTTSVYYDLIKRSSNQSVWTQTITRSYTAQGSDAFLGVERLRLANEGSARANIQGLIEELVRSAPQ